MKAWIWYEAAEFIVSILSKFKSPLLTDVARNVEHIISCIYKCYLNLSRQMAFIHKSIKISSIVTDHDGDHNQSILLTWSGFS